jgi:hypothetical protein
MSLALPLQGTAVRELIDVQHLAQVADPANRQHLVGLVQARLAARQMLAADRAMRSITMYVLVANGDLCLYRFGCRGGQKKLWNFGAL